MDQVGIVELRKAEERATSEIERARKERAARMKLAKGESDKEIEAYRKEQEARLEQLLAAQEGSDGALNVAAMQGEADKEMEVMATRVGANTAKVVDMLLEVVMRVDMKIPEARKGVVGSS